MACALHSVGTMPKSPLKSKILLLSFVILAFSLTGCFEFLFGDNTVSTVGDAALSVNTAVTSSLAPDGDVSLPISYIDGSQLFAPANDAEGLFPVVTFAEAIVWNSASTPQDADGDGFYDDSYVAVSTDAAALTTASTEAQWHGAQFFKTAFAATSAVQLCPISTANTVECFFDPKSVTPTQLHLALSTGTGVLFSEVITETVQDKMYYLRNAQSDVLYANNSLYAIADTHGVEVAPDATGLHSHVTGDHTNDYEAFAAEGDSLIYDAANNFFATLNTTTGVTLEQRLAESVWYNADLFTNSEATTYTVFKPYGDTIYYGIAKESDNEAFLYNLYEGTSHYSNTSDLLYEHLCFVAPGDLDAHGQQITHTETVHFDFNSERHALVVFKNGEGQWLLRSTNNAAQKVGGKRPLSSPVVDTLDLRSIEFFGNDRALILDNLNKRLWLVGFDPANEILTQTLRDFVPLGNNPVDLILNANEDRAYVLNVDDESISVVNLANGDGSKRYDPQVIATFYTNLPGKNFKIKPNTMTLSDTALYIGSQNTKAILEIPLAQISEVTIADEDFDGDGTTSAQGDCADNLARINPSQSEVCGDVIDNNCDGFVDEDCDVDHDGYTTTAGDCNDLDATISPGLTDICEDRIDNNCDGEIDDGCSDGVSYF